LKHDGAGNWLCCAGKCAVTVMLKPGFVLNVFMPWGLTADRKSCLDHMPRVVTWMFAALSTMEPPILELTVKF
jgi:hypothetical protein